MFNVGSWEVTMVLIAALLLLGPQKLPEFARWVGRIMREVRKTTQDVRDAIDFEMEKEEFNKLKEEFRDSIDVHNEIIDPIQNEISSLTNEAMSSMSPVEGSWEAHQLNPMSVEAPDFEEEPTLHEETPAQEPQNTEENDLPVEPTTDSKEPPLG